MTELTVSQIADICRWMIRRPIPERSNEVKSFTVSIENSIGQDVASLHEMIGKLCKERGVTYVPY